MAFSPIELKDSRRKAFALAVIVAAQFMVVLDVAIVNVALPAIKADLHFAEANLQWVISAYAILVRRRTAAGRAAGRHPRPPAHVHDRACAVFDQLAAVRAVLVGSVADRLPRAPRLRRRASRAGRAFDSDDDLRRGCRDATVALGIWGAASGSGGAAGVLLGGRSDVVSQLVVGLLHQRPGRYRSDRR